MASESDTPELEHAREAILLATLAHVPFDGWSDKALAAGIADAGQREALAKLAFPDGPADLAAYYCAFADRRMVAALDAEAVAEMRIRERIAHVVRLRLAQAEGEREAVAELMTWFAFPGNQPLAAKCLYRTVDAMWRAIGDTSTDFNFYSKRAILAAVLSATVFYWIGDESEAAMDTAAFLDRRIDDVMAFERAKGRAQEWLAELPDPFRILRDVTGRARGRDGAGGGQPGENGGAGGAPGAGSSGS
ncbi:MAG: COQ9 family protein [Alphaproteobacteria bacterium]|nr:COQ9 family protein [Alphaproteobacteria bacterium]